MSLSSHESVNDTILNFTNIIDSVHFGNFDMELPLTFTTPQGSSNPNTNAATKGRKHEASVANSLMKKKCKKIISRQQLTS